MENKKEYEVHYFKGTSKVDNRHMIFAVYDEPHEHFKQEPYMVVASAMEMQGLKHYATIEDCEKENFILREIPESEYECYHIIQGLLTEMYLHDFTGGFPNVERVEVMSNYLSKQIKTWLQEIKSKEDK